MKLITYFIVVLISAAVIAEAVMRVSVKFNASYYVGFKNDANTIINYPYGKIIINSDGYPDGEIRKTKVKRRIAYVGDSVCYGVGAGYGYRISEILEQKYPDYEHINFGAIGNGIDDASIAKLMGISNKYEIDAVIFIMNLNDIQIYTEQNVEKRVNNEEPSIRRYYRWL